MSDSLRSYGLQPMRLLCPWDSPGKNTGAGCHALLQEIFLTQGSNSPLFRLLHWLAGSLSTEPPGEQPPPPCPFSLSNTNYLPKATSSNTITLGIRVSICELQQGRGHEVGNKNSVHSKYLHISYTFTELV